LDRNIDRYTASISNEEVANEESKYQKLRQSLLEYELIVDSAEQPIQRTCGLPGAEKILLR
jgi:hypothetical protein